MSNQPIDQPSTAGSGGVPAELALIRRHVQELTDTMWAARHRAEIMDAVAEIESLKSTLDALELGAVRELSPNTFTFDPPPDIRRQPTRPPPGP